MKWQKGETICENVLAQWVHHKQLMMQLKMHNLQLYQQLWEGWWRGKTLEGGFMGFQLTNVNWITCIMHLYLCHTVVIYFSDWTWTITRCCSTFRRQILVSVTQPGSCGHTCGLFVHYFLSLLIGVMDDGQTGLTVAHASTCTMHMHWSPRQCKVESSHNLLDTLSHVNSLFGVIVRCLSTCLRD